MMLISRWTEQEKCREGKGLTSRHPAPGRDCAEQRGPLGNGEGAQQWMTQVLGTWPTSCADTWAAFSWEVTRGRRASHFYRALWFSQNSLASWRIRALELVSSGSNLISPVPFRKVSVSQIPTVEKEARPRGGRGLAQDHSRYGVGIRPRFSDSVPRALPSPHTSQPFG